MEPRLTQTQLLQVIAEIEQLSKQREAELEPEQVKEILRELNLPDELLEDALVQLQRRQALTNQRRRHQRIALALALSIVGAISIFWTIRHTQQQAIAQVTAVQERISLQENGGASVSQISRQTNPRVYYNVTLQNAPVGRQLSLQCDWIAPNGQTLHQSNYQTRPITTSVWNTYCFYDLSSNALPGNWEVRMLLRGHVLDTQTFRVQ
jgi:hypothetical protein